MGRTHKAIYRLSGGRWLGTVAGMPVLLLTTTGRHSGRPRTAPLTYFEDGDDLVVIASNGGEDAPPGWWLNLCSDARATVTRGRELISVEARAAAADERARLWPWITAVHPGYARYAERTTRPIPVVILCRTKENAPGR